MTYYPAPYLPIGEICAEAPRLSTEVAAPIAAVLRRDAFHLSIEAAAGQFPPRAVTDGLAATLKALSPELQAEAAGMFADYVEDVRAGIIPEAHQLETVCALDLDGTPIDWASDKRPEDYIAGNVDCWWPDGHTAVVLQHRAERDPSLGRPDLDLELGFYGIALTQAHGLTAMRLGACYHSPGRIPRYVWSGDLGEEQTERVWQRIRRSAGVLRRAVVGEHCNACGVRLHCRAHLAPAFEHAHEALRPFVDGSRLSPQSAARALRVIASMRDAARLVEGRLMAYAREIGGIPDEANTSRRWGPHRAPGSDREVFAWGRR